jgi:hypothetical protein
MPEADKVTPELNPFAGVMVMVVMPLLLRAMLRLAGDADKLKLGAGVTVNEIVVDLFRLPLTLLMVTVKVPVAALVPAVSANVLVLVVLTGLKDAVTPLGRPAGKDSCERYGSESQLTDHGALPEERL